MCVPSPQLLLFTTVASGVSGMMSARAGSKEALRAGARNFERIEQQKQMASLSAEQETSELLKNFSQTMASNVAMRSFMGRDASDPSFKAFEKSNFDTLETDLQRMAIQGNQIQKNYDLQKFEAVSSATDRAKSIRRKGLLNLVGTATQGIMRADEVKIGD
jgi:succinyl-CoA synthetase alpha subunit